MSNKRYELWQVKDFVYYTVLDSLEPENLPIDTILQKQFKCKPVTTLKTIADEISKNGTANIISLEMDARLPLQQKILQGLSEKVSIPPDWWDEKVDIMLQYAKITKVEGPKLTTSIESSIGIEFTGLHDLRTAKTGPILRFNRYDPSRCTDENIILQSRYDLESVMSISDAALNSGLVYLSSPTFDKYAQKVIEKIQDRQKFYAGIRKELKKAMFKKLGVKKSEITEIGKTVVDNYLSMVDPSIYLGENQVVALRPTKIFPNKSLSQVSSK